MAVMFPKAYNIKTSQAGNYINGRWVEGAKVSNTIIGNAFPMTSDQVARLDIGDKNIGKISLITDQDLNISNKTDQTRGDYIQFSDGMWYELIAVNLHKGILPHKTYIGEYRKNETI